MSALPAFLRFSGHGPLLCGLAATRIIGWGSTYYAPSVLVGPMGRELGMGVETVFAGITILLVTGALIAPALGRQMDREGTRRAMCVGAVICALGVGLLGIVQGAFGYLACWLVIGIGHAMTLANVGSVTIAHLMGARTRRVIGLMMLVTGLASSIFWPLTAALNEAFGWRNVWLIFAAMQIVVVLPIHAAIPRYRASVAVAADAAAASPGEEGRVPGPQRRLAFGLVALAFAASGLVSWGLPLHLIALLQRSGLDQSEAVWVASLIGPATLLARLVDATMGERLPVERVALAGLLLGPLSCLTMAFVPISVATAAAFIIVLSVALGVISVARATLPLALFGRRGFGTMMGRLTVPQNLAFAAAPLLFAMLVTQFGTSGTLLISAAIQFIGFVAMLMLVRGLKGA